MLLTRSLGTAVVMAVIGLSASACATDYADDSPTSQYEQSSGLPQEEIDAQLQEEVDAYVEKQVAAAPKPKLMWICFWAPSYDRNWHNDVRCTKGKKVEVPYLRRGDNFITYDEIMASAREYQDALNGDR